MGLHWVSGHLPEQYRFAHEFAFECHDQLAQFVRSIAERGLTRVTFNMRPEHKPSDLSGLSGERLFDWLEENGYEETVGQIAFRSCVHALMGDMCHFIYEALRCSEKAKLTVAFALLRKPLRENLLFLEYLLGAPNEFLGSMWSNDIGEVAVDKLLREHKVPEIIRKANALTLNRDSFHSAFIYELRYDSSRHYSYDQLWHKAIHLVTTRRATATEAKNLNFIFSNADSHIDQWDYVYSTLPLLLFYAVDVCASLMLAMGVDRPLSGEDMLRRSIGFLLWGSDPARISPPAGSRLEDRSPLECPHYKQRIPFAWGTFQKLYDGGGLRCTPCRKQFRLHEFTQSA